MSTLDLHGVKHQDVETIVEDYIMEHEPLIYIITGNSKRMQDIVMKVLDKHKCKWMIATKNLGQIIVSEV